MFVLKYIDILKNQAQTYNSQQKRACDELVKTYRFL